MEIMNGRLQFKARRLDGQFEYGLPYKIDNAWFMTDEEGIKQHIDVETITQATGRVDRYGYMIFEGDVVAAQGHKGLYKVVYNPPICSFEMHPIDDPDNTEKGLDFCLFRIDQIEIIDAE